MKVTRPTLLALPRGIVIRCVCLFAGSFIREFALRSLTSGKQLHWLAGQAAGGRKAHQQTTNIVVALQAPGGDLHPTHAFLVIKSLNSSYNYFLT